MYQIDFYFGLVFALVPLYGVTTEAALEATLPLEVLLSLKITGLIAFAINHFSFGFFFVMTDKGGNGSLLRITTGGASHSSYYCFATFLLMMES